MLQAIAGHDAADGGSVDVPVPDYRAELDAGVAGLTIGVERRHFFYAGVAADVRRAVESVLDTLRDGGARIVEVELPELAWTPEVLMTIMASEAGAYHRKLLRERPADYDPETRRALASVPLTNHSAL